MSDKPIQFADGIIDATVNFGVARITLAQLGQDGKPAPSGQLMIPVVQLPAFANGLLTIVRQIDAKMKESQAKQDTASVPEEAPMPGSFTFGAR